jgi:hypothetical protein
MSAVHSKGGCHIEIVYKPETQAEIDRIKTRLQEIADQISSSFTTAKSINILSHQRQINPNYNPLDENAEYQMLSRRLQTIYMYSVPSYLLSEDEYRNFIESRGEFSHAN